MKTRLIITLILIVVYSGLAFCQNNIEKSQTIGYNELKTEFSGNGLHFHWGRDTGTPEIITITRPLAFDKDAYKSARKFLNKMNKTLNYRSNIDTLSLSKINENKYRKYFRFQQEYQGIQVKGGEYVVTVLDSGKVRTALGRFYKNIKLQTKPQIDLKSALEIALKNQPRNTRLFGELQSDNLIIYPYNENYYLVYELHLPTSNQESWCYYINANTGEIIEMKSDVIYLSHVNVFLRHPDLDVSYTTISPVNNLNENGYLQGAYAYIVNDEASDAYNSNDDFRFSTSNTHFDEANLYYHIDRYRTEFWNNIGFDEFTQITAHAHHDFDSPNASYNLTDHHLRFSDGQGEPGFNSFAREDKVIYHEYTHAVTDFVADLYYAATQSGAIHEGNSDYFPASFTNRVEINEYAAQNYSRDITNPIIADYTEWRNFNYCR